MNGTIRAYAINVANADNAARRLRRAWQRGRLQLISSVLMVAISVTSSSAIAQSYTFALGRLFLTPEQRRQLDQQSKKSDQTSATPNASGAGSAAGQQAVNNGHTLLLDGWLRRSEGSSTVWLNAQPQLVPANGTAATAGGPRLVGEEVIVRDAKGLRKHLVPGPKVELGVIGNRP